jgi:nucleoredoxin
VRGLPALVILDSKGNVITKDGRNSLIADPNGENFPWPPKPISSILGSEFEHKSGEMVGMEALKGKYIGIYFASLACLPSRTFTSQLISLYNKLKRDKKAFEVILVSPEPTYSTFTQHFSTMPWLAIDYDDTPRKAELRMRFEIKGFPSLVLLDPEFNVITTDGRCCVSADPTGREFPWLPPAYSPLDDAAMAYINDIPFVLVNTNGSDREVAVAVASLGPPATDYAAKKSLPKLKFLFVEDTSEQVYEMVTKIAKLDSTQSLVIIDLLYSRKYVCVCQNITPGNISTFVNAYLDGKLTPTQLPALL